MERNNKLELLGNAPIPKALMSLGVPIMIGMLIPYILHCSSLWAKVRPVFSWVYADKAFVLFQSFYFFLLCGE